MSTSKPRVLLVTMPWMNPAASSLALATLRPILEKAGISTNTLYGSVLFPHTDTDPGFLDHYGSYLFVPQLYPDTDVEALLDHVADEYLDEINLGGRLADNADDSARMVGVTRQKMRTVMRLDIARARACMDRCFEAATRERYDVVAFTLTFETQIPSSLALARRLKAHDASIKIAFGGAACFEEQGDGLVASFPELDAVCHTEGEHVVVPLVRALCGEIGLEEVAGVSFRDGEGRVVHNRSPDLIRDMDSLPTPQYDDYLLAFEASDWRHLSPKLFFETSRGCWWGQKQLCTFCGLNAEGIAFRSKSPERAYEEIRTLYERYPTATHLQATDNIADMRYFKTLFPRLAEMPRHPERPLRIFYEVKANMKPTHLALMRAAGVNAVQPGIESFSDDILKLMRKGCTGLGQVQFIKWADQEGVKPVYNILISNPGEHAAAYREMSELLPYITHLTPPSGVTCTALERFSPYFTRAAEFGIRDMRPRANYSKLFPDPAVDLLRIAYQFDYSHEMHDDAELLAEHRSFASRVLKWVRWWKPHQAYYLDRDDHLVVVDRRSGGDLTMVLGRAAAGLYRFLDTIRSWSVIEAAFSHLEPELIQGLLDGWRHRRWIYRSSEGKYLAVLPRRYASEQERAGVVAQALQHVPAKQLRPRSRSLPVAS